VTQFEDEQHHVLSVRYNRVHDQLVIAGSSSTYLSLYRATTISSAPQNTTFAGAESLMN